MKAQADRQQQQRPNEERHDDEAQQPAHQAWPAQQHAQHHVCHDNDDQQQTLHHAAAVELRGVALEQRMKRHKVTRSNRGQRRFEIDSKRFHGRQRRRCDAIAMRDEI